MNSKMLVPNINESQKSLLEKHMANIALGDKEALADLYKLTKSAVYGFALSILKNTHEAEDVLQEVYIKVYENALSYKSNEKPLSWILTITKNLSLMKIRKNKNHMDVDELKEILADILHSVSGLKHREIAKMLELPLATVLSKYNRAIKKIKRKMGEEKNEKERN